MVVSMPRKKFKQESTDLRFDGVPEGVVNTLQNIAKNLGITMNDMLKPKWRGIIDSYPEYLKKEPSNKKCKLVAIRGVSPKLVKETNNIAENLGVDRNQIFKMEALKIIDSFEDRLKKEPPKF